MDTSSRLVTAQAVALAGLLWPGRARWRLPRAVVGLASITTAAGTALAVAGALPHGTRLTPHVAPPRDLPLLQDGVYAHGRNPIYAGLLLAGAGWALLRRRPETVVAWVALTAVLQLKVRHEERHLEARFGDPYRAYVARTPRFWPLPGRTRHGSA